MIIYKYPYVPSKSRRVISLWSGIYRVYYIVLYSLYYYIILYKEPPKSRCPQKSRRVISLWSGIYRVYYIVLYSLYYYIILYKEPPKSRCPQKSRRVISQKSRCVISPSHSKKVGALYLLLLYGVTTSLSPLNRR